jgi:hypothetical protein
MTVFGGLNFFNIELGKRALNLTLAALIFIFFALIVAWCRIAIRGGSIKKQWWPIVIGVFLGWNILIPFVRGATYHGKVVDEETGDPIAGAVVTVIWYESPIIHMANPRNFQNAHETLTQNDGSFSLWTWPGISFNPLTVVLTPPAVIIYKAGYAPLSVPTTYNRGYTSYEALADALKKGIVMKLPKLKTREEALRFADPGVGGDVPYHRIFNLVREVNAHRKKIGLSSRIY